MRKVPLDEPSIKVICLWCGGQHLRPVSWFERNTKLTCDECNSETDFINKQLQADYNEFAATMQALRRSVPNL